MPTEPANTTPVTADAEDEPKGSGPTVRQAVLARLGTLPRHALSKPGWTIAVLSTIAFVIGLAQQWPEVFFGGHAVGQFVRNLAYALVGAVVFNWILVEIPAGRRKLLAYKRHEPALDYLVKFGPSLLAGYRGAAEKMNAAHSDPDAWDRESIMRCARSIYEVAPIYFGEERRRFLAIGIRGTQEFLDGMEPASYFLDLDVAVALALFPAERGLHQLQPPPSDLPDPWQRDAHIVWELLEASRSLYAALQECAPHIQIQVEQGNTLFPDGTTYFARLSDVSPQR